MAIEGDLLVRLLTVLALIVVNGFFVAAEFALVTARKTRIDALASQGSRAAVAVQKAISDPNRFISSCQLGITMASLALGWVGEETISNLVERPLSLILPPTQSTFTSHAVAVPIAFAVITFLHITLGEQIPKMVALQRGESTALLTVGPTVLVGFIFRPFIALLSWATDVGLRALGLSWQAESHQAYSVEDLKALLRSSRGGSALAEDPGSLAERSLEFSDLIARQVMVPRTEMVAVPVNTTAGHVRELMRAHEHSRYPVFEESHDNVVGVLSANRTLLDLDGVAADQAVDLRSHTSTPLVVPEQLPAHRVLAAMKQQHTHLAIVVDEYGATAGIISVRDLLDRISGELRDEDDVTPGPIEWLPDGSLIVDGMALISDVEDEIGLALAENHDYDTLGGLLFGQIGRRPEVGDKVEIGGCAMSVEELDGLRIARIRVLPKPK